MTLLEWLENDQYETKVASSLIKQGKVSVNSVVETLINYKVKPKDIITVNKQISEYVSRGAHKLLGSIKSFGLNFKDKVILDIGSSTGGFTQVALLNGAKKVYSVDVGTNQLAYKLRRDERVVVMEKTNLKTLVKKSFSDEIDFVVCDVSFISLDRVFDVLKNILAPEKELMALIKPQFEAKSTLVESGGVVNKSYHNSIIKEVKEYAKQQGFAFIDITESPIKGKLSKNIEYLSLFRKDNHE